MEIFFLHISDLFVQYEEDFRLKWPNSNNKNDL